MKKAKLKVKKAPPLPRILKEIAEKNKEEEIQRVLAGKKEKQKKAKAVATKLPKWTKATVDLIATTYNEEVEKAGVLNTEVAEKKATIKEQAEQFGKPVANKVVVEGENWWLGYINVEQEPTFDMIEAEEVLSPMLFNIIAPEVTTRVFNKLKLEKLLTSGRIPIAQAKKFLKDRPPHKRIYVEAKPIKKKGSVNPVTFNDKFERLFSNWPNGSIHYRMEHSPWRTSPLFLHETTLKHEFEAIQPFKDKQIMENLPFPIFRLDASVTANIDSLYSGKYKAKMLIYHEPDVTNVLAIITRLFDDDLKLKLGGEKLGDIWMHLKDIQWSERDKTYAFSYSFGEQSYGWLPGAIDHMIAEGMGSSVCDTLACFIVSAMSPSTHTAVVTPSKHGKSVEWIRARTHYTLITHGHPANKATVKHGSRVAVNEEEERHRMAGARRAHFRQLRHPRYRFALNRKDYPNMPAGTIWIQKTWVGPKEWQDEGGKQIYRILEPKK